MTQNNMEVVAGKWLLMKRGLYWMPNSQGYTGLKSEAGRYTDEEVAVYRRNDEREVFILEAETADEIAPKCWPDVAERHLQGLLTSAQAEIERLAKERDEWRKRYHETHELLIACDEERISWQQSYEGSANRAEAAEKERDALREALEEAREDTARLDYLDQLNARLNAHYKTNYGWEMVINHNVNRIFFKFPDGVDLNDMAIPGAKSCRVAIDAHRPPTTGAQE